MLETKMTSNLEVFHKLWSKKNASIYRQRKLYAALGKVGKKVIAATQENLKGGVLKQGTGELLKSLQYTRKLGKTPYAFNKTGSTFYAKLSFETLWYGAYWEGVLDTTFPKTVRAETYGHKAFMFYTAMGRQMFLKKFTHKAAKPWFSTSVNSVLPELLKILEDAAFTSIE